MRSRPAWRRIRKCRGQARRARGGVYWGRYGMGIGEAQSLARHALGEAAYRAALGRGAAMDDDEVIEYAMGEFGRLAVLRAEPGAQAPESPPGPARPSRRGMTL